MLTSLQFFFLFFPAFLKRGVISAFLKNLGNSGFIGELLKPEKRYFIGASVFSLIILDRVLDIWHALAFSNDKISLKFSSLPT